MTSKDATAMPARNRRPTDERVIPRYNLTLEELPGEYAVCRLPEGAEVPTETPGAMLATLRCDRELGGPTILCEAKFAPPEAEVDQGWHAIRLEGTFDFGEVGVLVNVVVPLARSGVPVVVATSFSTDYVLVKTRRFDRIRHVLEEAGHAFSAS
jgi:hypothetical protein